MTVHPHESGQSWWQMPLTVRVLVVDVMPRSYGRVVRGGRPEPDEDPNDLAALDAAWEEEEVTFGPGAAAAAQCGKDGLISKIRAVQRPAPGVPASKPQRPVITYSQRPRS